MSKHKDIVLVCSPLRFYTHNDETLCFEWIQKISCIKDYKGVGRALHLFVSSSDIANEDLLDLIGLFDRYGFDMQQLNIFKNEENEKLFQ